MAFQRFATARAPRPFANRREAGRALATLLESYRNNADAIVLGLPRGGIPVAYEIATALDLALDAFIVRKLGMPGHEELAMGAIASGGIVVMNPELLVRFGIGERELEAITERERLELVRREALYRDSRPRLKIAGKLVIVVDDGLATGSSMSAAIEALREEHPKRIVVAVPVGARETCDRLATQADELIVYVTPEPFYAVGLYYDDFGQTTDEEVRELLNEAHGRFSATHGAP